jgi:hypothetical protein
LRDGGFDIRGVWKKSRRLVEAIHQSDGEQQRTEQRQRGANIEVMLG